MIICLLFLLERKGEKPETSVVNVGARKVNMRHNAFSSFLLIQSLFYWRGFLIL